MGTRRRQGWQIEFLDPEGNPTGLVLDRRGIGATTSASDIGAAFTCEQGAAAYAEEMGLDPDHYEITAHEWES